MRVEVQPLTGFDQLLTYAVSKDIFKIKIGCLRKFTRTEAGSGVFSLVSNETIDPKNSFFGGLSTRNLS